MHEISGEQQGPSRNGAEQVEVVSWAIRKTPSHGGEKVHRLGNVREHHHDQATTPD